MDDFKKIIYSVLIGFATLMVVWLGFIFINACGFDFTCRQAAVVPVGTSIPTLIPATMPAPTRFVPSPTSAVAESATQPAATTAASEGPSVPRPSNPGDSGPALNLTGDATAGAQVFAANCISCHGSEGTGGVANPGSTDGQVPALNPIDPMLKDPDPKIFAYNLDLFIEHGSKPAGPSPVFVMPAWGDLGALTPQQIADVIAYLISLNP